MKQPINRNKDGYLKTVDQAAQKYNLGRQLVRKIAEESGSIVRVGRAYRIKDDDFCEYLLTTYRAER